MNLIVLQGNLTATPELRTTAAGIECCNFTVAVNRPVAAGKDPVTDFIPCTAWRQTAAFVCKYFEKGDGILVEGSMETGKYTDKSGQERKTYSVQARRVEFGRRRARPEGPKPVPADGEPKLIPTDEELPF